MEKTQFTSVQLSKGVMEIYDFGSVKLHALKTNDLISDECFLVEKDGRCFMIESPCFFDNIKELEKYISDNGLKYEGAVIAYHGAGASFMKESKVYSTKNADAAAFKAAVQSAYPKYSGLNYLDMSAGMFFPGK